MDKLNFKFILFLTNDRKPNSQASGQEPALQWCDSHDFLKPLRFFLSQQGGWSALEDEASESTAKAPSLPAVP